MSAGLNLNIGDVVYHRDKMELGEYVRGVFQGKEGNRNYLVKFDNNVDVQKCPGSALFKNKDKESKVRMH